MLGLDMNVALCHEKKEVNTKDTEIEREGRRARERERERARRREKRGERGS